MHLRRMALRAALAAVFGLLVTLLVPVSSASAGTTILCKGFKQCATQGRYSAGYAGKYHQMWWRMYSGHNCTNYASYRMVKAGLSTTRPWTGSGNASNWGRVMSDRTNNTAMVGSIAWWHDRNHVQYVEQVVNSNTIVVSEDHYRGDFDWATVTRGSSSWPDGFIHLADAAMQATALPAVTGTPKVDVPLTVTTGSWTPSPMRYRYQWLANGSPIQGAVSNTLTPTPAQVGALLAVKVTARRYGYVAGARTATSTATVAPGSFTVTRQPTISGLAKVGSVLRFSPGSWQPTPSSMTSQWFADGQLIPGATSTSLRLKPAQLNKAITVMSTVRRPGYATQQTASAPTAAVAPVDMQVLRESTLAGDPELGRTLTLTPGRTSPADVTIAYRWQRDGVRIRGAIGRQYRITPSDLGARIAGRVLYTKPGYRAIVENLSTSRRATSLGRISVASPRHRQVRIRVTASGVGVVRGYVTITTRNGTHRTRRLKNGATTFRPTWLYSGQRPLTVSYNGSRKVTPESTRRMITVR